MAVLQERIYLGRVTRAPSTLGAYHYATVEPLVESDESGTRWIGPIKDAQARFPKRGRVHWHDAPVPLKVNSLWQFAIDEVPEIRREGKPEEFQVIDPTEPIEAIDLRAWTDEMALRSAVTGQGVELDPTPIARQVVLWLASGVCVGPLLLNRTSDGVRWVFDATEAHRDAARMPVWHLAAGDINGVMLDGKRWFLSPPQRLDRSAGTQNWAADILVAKSVLRRLRKMDPELIKAMKVTDSVFEKYLERLSSAELLGSDAGGDVERARADRLRGIRAAVERDRGLLKEAAEALLQSEPVRAELERHVAEAREKLLDEKRVEVAAAFEERRTELARLDTDIQERSRRVSRLDEALLAKAQEIEEKVASFDREVTSRLEEIARRPEAAFAENAILRAALLPFARPSEHSAPSIGLRSMGSARTAPAIAAPDPEYLKDEEALRRELAEFVVASGTSLHAALALHAALLAGTVPVLIGARAFDLLKRYASVVAGGRLHWVPAGSSLLEPQDLFGRFDTSLSRIVPHPAGLLDVVLDANTSGRMHLVVLEGFNRAPIEAYLLPILETAAAARQGDSSRAIPVASPALLSEDDPYCEASRIAWPPNVLLTCLPAHGSVTLPVAPDAWRYLTVIDADDRERPVLPIAAASGQASGRTEVTADLWRGLTTMELPESCAKSNPKSNEVLERLAGTWGLTASDALAAADVYRVLCRNRLPASEALAIAIASTLVPRTMVAEKVLDESLKAAGAPKVIGWRPIHDEVERLRV